MNAKLIVLLAGIVLASCSKPKFEGRYYNYSMIIIDSTGTTENVDNPGTFSKYYDTLLVNAKSDVRTNKVSYKIVRKTK